MQIIIKQEKYQIKNGYTAHSLKLELTDYNLKGIILNFLTPLGRQGNLDEEIRRLKKK